MGRMLTALSPQEYYQCCDKAETIFEAPPEHDQAPIEEVSKIGTDGGSLRTLGSVQN